MNNYNIDKALILFSQLFLLYQKKSCLLFSLIESLKIDIDDNWGGRLYSLISSRCNSKLFLEGDLGVGGGQQQLAKISI